jgi:hypothetical protein
VSHTLQYFWDYKTWWKKNYWNLIFKKSQHFWCQNEIYRKNQEGHHNHNQATCFRLSSPSTTSKLTSATKTSYCQKTPSDHQHEQYIKCINIDMIIITTTTIIIIIMYIFFVNLWVLLPTKSKVLVALWHLFQGQSK